MSGIARTEVRVVHLERAADRRALMEAEFRRVGIIPDAWGGVDAHDPAQAGRVSAMPDRGPWGPMEAHAKGCLLSHMDALTAFLAGDASHLLVLEDDVFLADDIAAWLAGDWWPRGAHIVKLERWRDNNLLILLDKSGHRHAGRDLRRMRTRHSGSAGYVINRSGAAIVRDKAVVDVPSDHMLFNPAVSSTARSLSRWQVSPALMEQGNDPLRTSAVTRGLFQRSRRETWRRGITEAKVLLQLPYLVSGRSRLEKVSWVRSPDNMSQ